MKPFLTTKRKIIELLILLLVDALVYLLWGSLNFIILFSFGFIWNWCVSQNLDALFENRRSRFSTLKTVINLQYLFLRPFGRFPSWAQRLAGALPAGIFWSMVILFNDSDMPWWATFLGSLFFELLQWEINFISKHKETIP